MTKKPIIADDQLQKCRADRAMLLEALEAFVADDWAHMDDEELAHELSLGNQMVAKHIAGRAAVAKARGQA